ncbi:MAG: 16S rRNA (cytosine(967)-C(5))-methyltransferase RsmB [gamma proteobacterium symbiont of Taylorina sp.]|nr:16S rRNA (cytosine(967)-C(5))-methyltransferase RsmB [gamma proteobacterium symbiont of Taylorina sp.]
MSDLSSNINSPSVLSADEDVCKTTAGEFTGRGLSSRAVAVLVVQECIESKHSLSAVLPRYLDQLKENQRPLAQEISFGVLRWYFRLNPLLSKMLTKPLRGKKITVHYLLLAGLYQINYLDKAEYATVKETVNICDELQLSWAKGLVNAILRRFLREKGTLLNTLDASWESLYAYPEWLIKQIKLSWKDIVKHSEQLSIAGILDAGNQRPPMTIRVNAQYKLTDYQLSLEKSGIPYCLQETCAPEAITLEKPVAVEQLPFFSSGGVSVQDAAPQLAAALLAPQAGDRILDACAAPGGKTMHLYEKQMELEKIIALDVSRERLERVRENSLRLNVPAEKIDLIAADASHSDWWDGQLFERILLDAPCSATGVIRRHPDIKILRRLQDITDLTALQAQILDNCWAMLKPGGTLLYATCSILRSENDQQTVAFIERIQNSSNDIQEIPINVDWGHAMSVGRQILPGEHNMDGFYYALFKKDSESNKVLNKLS